MSDLHVVSGNEGFGLIDHIKALDERVGLLEMKVFPPVLTASAAFYGNAEDPNTISYEEQQANLREHVAEYQASQE
jgi:NAD(P)H-dependent FMN reductase